MRKVGKNHLVLNLEAYTSFPTFPDVGKQVCSRRREASLFPTFEEIYPSRPFLTSGSKVLRKVGKKSFGFEFRGIYILPDLSRRREVSLFPKSGSKVCSRRREASFSRRREARFVPDVGKQVCSRRREASLFPTSGSKFVPDV